MTDMIDVNNLVFLEKLMLTYHKELVVVTSVLLLLNTLMKDADLGLFVLIWCSVLGVAMLSGHLKSIKVIKQRFKDVYVSPIFLIEIWYLLFFAFYSFVMLYMTNTTLFDYVSDNTNILFFLGGGLIYLNHGLSRIKIK